MPNSNTEIRLKITIDNKDAVATISLTDEELKQLGVAVRQAGEESRDAGSKIVHSFAQARNMIQGLREAVNFVFSSFRAYQSAWQEQEAALVKLNTALAQSNKLNDANLKSLTDYAAELQQITIYGDEVTETVMAQLIAMGLNVDQTKQATLMAANLATVMGTNLSTAARVMADLFAGDATMIKRYVKGIDEAVLKSGDLDAILKMLNESIGGQAEAMGKTATGQIAIFNNAIGDLKENAGEMISTALAPVIKLFSDIISKLNQASPVLSGFIGLTMSLTSAFVTLRVSGIVPAIDSITLFGTALTGLKAAMIKTGIGALIVGLGYGFSELAKAYDNFKQVQQGGAQSYNDFLAALSSAAAKASKEELNWMLTDAAKSRDKLTDDLNRLNAELKNAKQKVVTKDKDGNEYINYYDTDQSKYIEAQIKQTEHLLKIQKDSIKIYQDQKNFKKKTGDTPSGDFSDQLASLKETQRHREAMLQLESNSDTRLFAMKLKHFNELIALYKKFGKDTTELVNRRLEAETKFMDSISPKGMPLITDQIPKSLESVDSVITKVNLGTLSWADSLNAAVDIAGSLQFAFEAAGRAVASTMAQSIRLFNQANSLLQIFLNTLAQVAAQKAAEGVFNWLAGSGGSGGSVFGDIFNSIFSMLPFFGEGGVVTKPMPAVVGDVPEAIIPLHRLAFMMQQKPVAVNTTVNLQGEASVGLTRLHFRLKKIEDFIDSKY